MFGNPQIPSTSTPLGNTSLIQSQSSIIEAYLTVYQTNFDDLREEDRADTIVMLLETVPSVKEMRTFLVHRGRHSEPSLTEWKDRISPAALGLLRWIIASNRSCIVQVDRFTPQTESDDSMVIDNLRLDEKISGVEGWLQFRFAQGAPDKELRFQKALSETKLIHNARYPTLFAWHGSALGNWHSIIRGGLDFKEVRNGRAFGDGCYFSQDHSVSLGYCLAGNNVSSLFRIVFYKSLTRNRLGHGQVPRSSFPAPCVSMRSSMLPVSTDIAIRILLFSM
jgi:hypothetical protein